jgi:hypothetical protein
MSDGDSDRVLCHHTRLELLPERKKSVRCRHCHLTMDSEDLGDDCCPECFEVSGEKRYDFDEMAAIGEGARYRCEDCGAIVKSA